MTLTQINKAGLDELALDHVFTIGASGNSAYTFQGEGLNGTVNNPTLYLTRGKTYRFENGSGGHPIRIQSTSGASGTAYNTGVTNNAGSGTVIVEVQHDAPDVLYYQCTSHAAMNGILYITGALADSGVTTAKLADNAVTSAKIANGNVTNAKLAGDIPANKLQVNDAHIIIGDASADGTLQTLSGDVSMTRTGAVTIANDAVTTAKIATDAVTGDGLASNSVNTTHLVDTSVTTAKIADEAVTLAKLEHGTSSNDGKFLRANNGADPTFETVTGTTINNNADNRVITGSGTANTLEGEANLIYDGLRLGINRTPTTNADYPLQIKSANVTAFAHFRSSQSAGDDPNSHGGLVGILNDDMYLWGRESGSRIIFGTSNAERARFTGDGLCFNGDTAATNALDDYEEGTWTPIIRGPGGTGTAGAGNAGFYTKIGNTVHVHATVHWTALSGTTSGVVQVLGLPYATKNVSHYRSTSLMGGQVVGVHNGNNAAMNIALGVDANQSFVYVTGVNGSSTASYNYTHTPTVNSTGQIFGFALTYLT